jgi:hypothetical protein
MRRAMPVAKPIGMSTNAVQYQDPQEDGFHKERPLKKQPGCWFWGSIILVILLVVVGVGGYFMITKLLGAFTDMAVNYSETAPMPIERSTMSQADYQALAARIEAFQAASKTSVQPDALALSGDDINALIANHPDWLPLRDHVHVALEGDRILANVCLPLDDFAKFPMVDMEQLKGRFLNATGVVSMSLRDGEVSLRVHELDFHGKQLPEDIMASLRDGNVLSGEQGIDELDKVRTRANAVWVEDGMLKIEARKPQ